MNWAADTVHFVLFAPQPTEYDVLAVWQELFGTQPAGFQRNSAQVGGGSLANGPFGNDQAIMSVNVGRIELAVAPSGNSPPPEIPMLHNPSQALDILHPLAHTLVDKHDASRLSIVTKLARRFSTAQETSKAFSEFTGLPFPDHARELLVSANVPITFSDGEAVMNRIGKCQTSQRTTMFVPTSGAVGLAPITSVGEYFSYEIDINSQISNIKIERAKAHLMLDELLKETKQALSNGYGYVLHPNV